ncbi:MAG: hypothetical protein C0485_18215 [Pirellula sp.]|nr:hypothetical protein [Pirellula sp.]
MRQRWLSIRMQMIRMKTICRRRGGRSYVSGVLLACLTIFSTVAGSSTCAAGTSLVFDRIAKRGDVAAGLPEGVNFSRLWAPTLIGDEGVQFSATLRGPGVVDTNDSAWVIADASGVRLIGREGETMPGLDPGVVLTNAAHNQTNLHFLDTGSAMLFAKDGAAWVVDDAATTLLAYKGRQVPGQPEGVKFDLVVVSDAEMTDGMVSLSAQLTGPGVADPTQRYVLTGGLSGLTVAIRTGAVAPGTPTPALFSGYSYPRVNGSAKVVFRGSAVPTTGGATITGMWTASAGVATPVAIEGTAAPGLSGVTFDRFYPSTISLTPPTQAINSKGEVAFEAYLKGASVNSSNNLSIWSTAQGGLSLAARTGDWAPGTSLTTLFTEFNVGQSGTRFSFNDRGEIAFRGGLSGPDVTAANDRGIWAGPAGGLELIAREGDLIPVAAGDVRFGSFDSPLLNKDGVLLFTSSLKGADVATENDAALWARIDGKLTLVVREDDVIDIDPTAGQELFRVRSFVAGGITISSGLTLSDDGIIGFTVNDNNTTNSVLTARIVPTTGDFDADGDVDGADLARWRTSFGAATGANASNGDADGDHDVDGSDFLIWQQEFQPFQPTSAVPEPSTLVAAVLSGLCLGAVNRRSRIR